MLSQVERGDVNACTSDVAAAFKFGSSDEEDVEIPTSKTTPRDGVLEEVEDDEFEFYT